MTINLKIMEQIDQLIANKSTGKPAILCKKLGVSQATLYRYIKTMKKAGAPIEYNRIKGNYYYKRKGQLFLKFCDKRCVK